MASPAQPKPASWEDIVSAIAKQQGVNPKLALAVARKESAVDPSAVGDSGRAIGMFQLHEAAAADMGLTPEDRKDPIKNITAGIGYLKRQSDRFGGDINKALMAYNGGAEHVEAGTMSPQAQAYAAEVLADLSGGMRASAGAPLMPAASHPSTRGTPAPAFATMPLGTQSTPTGERFAPSTTFRGTEPATHATLLRDLKEDVSQQYDPSTPTGRVNIAATSAAVAASVFTGPEAMGIQPWLVRVLGPPAAAAIASGTERAVEQNVLGTTPEAEASPLTTGVTQGAYELGGQAMMWPVRRVWKAVVSPRIARAAAAGLADETAAAKSGLTAARDASKVMVERAEDLGRAATASARRAAVDKIVDTDLDNVAAINAVQAQYDNLLRAAPDVGGTVGQIRDVMEGPAKKALDQAGMRVAEAAKSGPPIAMAPIKDQLALITRRAKPESLFPAQPVKAAGFVPSNRLTLPATAAAQMQGMSQAELRAFVQEQLTKPAAERLPLSGILDTLQRAPETLDFADAHALKRLLDETVNWDVAAKSINKQLTKGIRTTLREALAVHEPYNVATGAYRALATLYRQGTGAKLTRALRNNPDAAARILDSKNPIGAQALYDLLVTQSAAGGEPQLGQLAWDSVRSAYLYNNILDGGVKNLSTRVKDLVTANPQFSKVVFGDESGMRVLSNLEQLGQAYETAVTSSAGFAQATKETGKELVATTKLAASQAVRQARQQGQRGIQAAKAGVTAAEAAQGAFGESTLAPFASRTAGQAVVETTRAGALGIKTYWGARAIARMLESPSSADVLAYLSFSPRLTQMATQVMLGQAPDRVTGVLLRDIGAALTPPMPSHKTGPTAPTIPSASPAQPALAVR